MRNQGLEQRCRHGLAVNDPTVPRPVGCLIGVTRRYLGDLADPIDMARWCHFFRAETVIDSATAMRTA
jgi:hypothetical protein